MRLIKYLCLLALGGLAGSADALTIVPTYDASITNDPDGPAMVDAIRAALQVFQTNYADDLTVYILFVNDPRTGLGENQTWGTDYSYSDYLYSLQSSATSVNDFNALSQLTNTFDPILGGDSIRLTLPHARVMGLDTHVGPDGFDSTISLNMALMNLTRPPPNPGLFDLQSVVEHETDEVLGTSSSLPDDTAITPMDLFRFDDKLERTFTVNGDNAYFSVDATNLWARYNMVSYGDYGDWWSDNDVFWAPPGITPHPQVQDAFGAPGTVQDLATNELTALDVIGYTLAAAVTPPSPTLSIASGGSGMLMLSWPTSATGFSLEERTSLSSGSWKVSTSGSANPALVPVAASGKFYRLSTQSVGAVATARPAVRLSTKAVYQRIVHSLPTPSP
jgi:hypothetical protein